MRNEVPSGQHVQGNFARGAIYVLTGCDLTVLSGLRFARVERRLQVHARGLLFAVPTCNEVHLLRYFTWSRFFYFLLVTKYIISKLLLLVTKYIWMVILEI